MVMYQNSGHQDDHVKLMRRLDFRDRTNSITFKPHLLRNRNLEGQINMSERSATEQDQTHWCWLASLEFITVRAWLITAGNSQHGCISEQLRFLPQLPLDDLSV